MLDATAPEIRKGKEREDGKPKKLSKMKKVTIVVVYFGLC